MLCLFSFHTFPVMTLWVFMHRKRLSMFASPGVSICKISGAGPDSRKIKAPNGWNDDPGCTFEGNLQPASRFFKSGVKSNPGLATRHSVTFETPISGSAIGLHRTHFRFWPHCSLFTHVIRLFTTDLWRVIQAAYYSFTRPQSSLSVGLGRKLFTGHWTHSAVVEMFNCQ